MMAVVTYGDRRICFGAQGRAASRYRRRCPRWPPPSWGIAAPTLGREGVTNRGVAGHGCGEAMRALTSLLSARAENGIVAVLTSFPA